jgi:hypothetical protein
MANVQHSALTGSDLHECKGADTAPSGTVPVATGGGTAVFQALSYAQLSNTPITKPQLNGAVPAGQVLIKVYTATATAGAWSVTPVGFSTIWAVHATCISGSQAVPGAAVAQVASVSTSAITGSNVQLNAAANVVGGTQTTYVTVIGV